MQKEENGMPVNIGLFLQTVHAALLNRQYQHGMFLLEYAIKHAENSRDLPSSPALDVAIGLHQGQVRASNEDCVLALEGTLPGTHEAFGLFVVCDGMGGHDRGQEAAQLATRTLLEQLVPLLERATAPLHGERILAKGIQQANRAIYLRNQSSHQRAPLEREPDTTAPISTMGTTITAVLLLGNVAFVANVGDSRTYLYDQRLRRITRDHSLVAHSLADGSLQEEDIYSHPLRNQITRALGAKPSVDIDTFVVPVQGHEMFLLCSDGLWGMTRDRRIEASSGLSLC